jgi:hypothetical protein
MKHPNNTVKLVQFGIARKAYKRTRAEIKNRPNITVPQILKWLDNQIVDLFELEAKNTVITAASPDPDTKLR